MKLKKKIIISTALLAVVGGLAGCGNQQSAQKTHTQQKAEQPNKRDTKKAELDNVYAQVMQADGDIPSKDHKNNQGIQPSDEALCVTIQQPTKAVPFKDGVDDSNDPIVQTPGYSLKNQVNSYWHDLYHKLPKETTRQKPMAVVFLFEYNTGKNDGNIYEVGYGHTNSPKFKSTHMKLIRSNPHDPNRALD